MQGRGGQVLAIAGLVAALLVFLASTGPRPEQEASGPIRRFGGVCLQLERWSLLGWSVVGNTYTVADTTVGRWHRPPAGGECDTNVPLQTYLVRPPFDAPTGGYRICGLADDEPCVEFRRIEFNPGPPGP